MQIIGRVEKPKDFITRMAVLGEELRKELYSKERSLELLRHKLQGMNQHGIRGPGSPENRLKIADMIVYLKKELLDIGYFVTPERKDSGVGDGGYEGKGAGRVRRFQ